MLRFGRSLLFRVHTLLLALSACGVTMSLVAQQIDSGSRIASPSVTGVAARFKIDRYVSSLMARYDTNGDGKLGEQEWQRMRGAPARIDANGDGLVMREEIVAHVASYAADRRLGPPVHSTNVGSPRSASEPTRPATRYTRFHVPAKVRVPGLPGWFLERDLNGDGQVSLSEYSPTVEASAVIQFRRLDSNSDGLITGSELVQQKGEADDVATPVE